MKRFEFELSDSLYDQAILPIRKKIDLLNLLAHTLKFLVLQSTINTTTMAEDRKLILYVDKMNRLFFCVKEKIFSFRFPFNIKENQEDSSLSISFKDYFKFDSIKSSLLLAILDQEDIFDGTLENVNDRILQEISENEWNNIADKYKELPNTKDAIPQPMPLEVSVTFFSSSGSICIPPFDSHIITCFTQCVK